MAGDPHGDPLAHAGTNHVSHTTPSEIDDPRLGPPWPGAVSSLREYWPRSLLTSVPELTALTLRTMLYQRGRVPRAAAGVAREGYELEV